MRTSYSALVTFKQCPQRYKFRIIDKKRESKTKEQLFGTLIHECLRFMFSHDPIFPTLDQVLDFYRSKFTAENWSADESAIYLAEGERMLRRYYQQNAPWNFSVLDLESRFEVVLEDPHAKKTHILAGIIDRIDKLPDGSYEIIDYKTQKRLPSQDKIDRDFQLSIYAMGLKRCWPHIIPNQIKLTLQFLKHGETLSTKRTESDFQKTKTETFDTINEIESRINSNSPFEPVVSPLCDFCGYKPICPAWKHLYKNVKSETIDGAAVPSVIKEYFSLRDEKKQAETRLKELAALLTRYLEAEAIDRVFSDYGVIARRRLEKYQYDFDKIRTVLEPLGKWSEIFSADEAKLKKIINEIPEWARAEIQKARSVIKTSAMLTATKKSVRLEQKTKSQA